MPRNTLRYGTRAAGAVTRRTACAGILLVQPKFDVAAGLPVGGHLLQTLGLLVQVVIIVGLMISNWYLPSLFDVIAHLTGSFREPLDGE